LGVYKCLWVWNSYCEICVSEDKGSRDKETAKEKDGAAQTVLNDYIAIMPKEIKHGVSESHGERLPVKA
jgi:hypothetical protein